MECLHHYQKKFKLKCYRTLPGLENVEMMRTAYAIEYDSIDPTAIKANIRV